MRDTRERPQPIGLNRRHLNRYRQVITVLVRHGFGALVSGMQLADMLRLPQRIFRSPRAEARSPAVHLRLALEELGGTFIKLGQTLSTRPDLLPLHYIEELSKLQDRAPQVPWEQIRASIEREVGGPLEGAFAAIDPEPLASASLGQVHAARLRQSDDAGPPPFGPEALDVVVKIQRPNAEQQVHLDLDILYDLAWRFQHRPEIARFADPVEVVREFAGAIAAELDYQREAHSARRFRDSFADDPDVVIPEVLWRRCTRRMLVMERLHGIKISRVEALEEAGHDRRRVARTLSDLYMKSIYEDRFFHADPHPGNIWVLAGGRIALLDFGRIGNIGVSDEAQLFGLVRAIILRDAGETAERLLRMDDVAGGRVDEVALERDVDRVLDRYVGVPLAQLAFGQVLQEVMHLAARHRLRLPSNWVLLLQTFAMLEGVLHTLDPDLDVFAAARPHVRRIHDRRLLPESWGPPLLQAGGDWFDLWRTFPKRFGKLLRQAERGDVAVELVMPDMRRAGESLDRSANRLSISLLVGSLIIAIGFVLQSISFERPWAPSTWLIVLGFGAVLTLGMWLVIAIWRADHRDDR
jgi:ubiquinone biosynthesis protein